MNEKKSQNVMKPSELGVETSSTKSRLKSQGSRPGNEQIPHLKMRSEILV